MGDGREAGFKGARRQIHSVLQQYMEKALEARKSKLSHTQRGNIRYKEIILDNLSEEPQTASTIAGMLGVSVQKASALCRQLVAEESVQVVEVAVPKKGKQKGYFI